MSGPCPATSDVLDSVNEIIPLFHEVLKNGNSSATHYTNLISQILFVEEKYLLGQFYFVVI